MYWLYTHVPWYTTLRDWLCDKQLADCPECSADTYRWNYRR